MNGSRTAELARELASRADWGVGREDVDEGAEGQGRVGEGGCGKSSSRERLYSWLEAN
jgi:hypothetical protein